MADLTDIQAAQSVKIIGTDSTGLENNPVMASAKGDLAIADGLHSGGVQGNVNLLTANVAYEAKVGISRLANRKCLVIMPLDFDMYWGFSNSVTTATGFPIFKNQYKEFALDPSDSSVQIWLVCSNANKNARVAEST